MDADEKGGLVAEVLGVADEALGDHHGEEHLRRGSHHALGRAAPLEQPELEESERAEHEHDARVGPRHVSERDADPLRSRSSGVRACAGGRGARCQSTTTSNAVIARGDMPDLRDRPSVVARLPRPARAERECERQADQGPSPAGSGP